MGIKRSVFLLCSIFLLFGCADETVKEDTRFRLVPSQTSGIDFNNKLSSSKDLNILNYLYFYNGAGVAAADLNNDGLIDLYFAANQDSDKLYMNQGNLRFKEVSAEAGISQEKFWSTGVSIVDINNDGLLDIYVCEVGDYKVLKGYNKLYINKGVNQAGIPQFTEEAAKYNLDFRGMSTQAAFLDYDLDGDLDMYLMNHSVHPNSSYGIGATRNERDSISGDRLYNNNNGYFTDVSGESGIFSSKIGYGLGLAVGDLNNDSYPDIYIGNDFFENDYLYINQQDDTFKDLISQDDRSIGHTSHYSMGVDIADFNNDGLADILSLDMLPEDLNTYKASGTEYSYQIYSNYINNGYAHQYMQNALQLNRGNAHFSEIGHLAGIAATEWSWAALFADLDNDGFKDIFISNGILGATNDMDYISFIANENIQKRLSQGISNQDLKIIEDIPVKKTPNYFFKNSGGYEFENKIGEWISNRNSFSNGAVYADLDNDGDLDLVTNNVNEEAFLYENLSYQMDSLNYLNISFKGPVKNKFGIGAKVTIYTSKGIQSMENYPTRGYLSSVPPQIHFGVGDLPVIDSLEVTWPGRSHQIIKNIKANQNLKIAYEDSKPGAENLEDRPGSSDVTFDINSTHREYSFKDFIYEPLIPYSQSNLGPGLSVIDFNNDGLDDIYFAGDQFNPGNFWIQDDKGKFSSIDFPGFDTNSREPVDHAFFDMNNDDLMDLIVVYGGSDPNTRSKNSPDLYLNLNGKLVRSDLLDNYSINASLVKTADLNSDGLEDIFIASNSDYGSYGGSQPVMLFLNQAGRSFKRIDNTKAGLQGLEMIYDTKLIDINNDEHIDVILAGHYLPLTILLNRGDGRFSKKELSNTEGWWNAVEVADFDLDGDLDIIVGNWGLNSRLKASTKEPIQLYLNDFDDNGKTDPILTYFYQGRETPLPTKDELSKQIPALNKSFLSYNAFAKADFNDYFSKEKITKAKRKKVVTLETSYFENMGDLEFSRRELPPEVQFSSVHAIHATDVNEDGYTDIILGGNNYHVNTQIGRLDADYGTILINNGNSDFQVIPGKLYVKGAIKSINTFKVKDENYLLFGINNEKIKILKYPNIDDQ